MVSLGSHLKVEVKVRAHLGICERRELFTRWRLPLRHLHTRLHTLAFDHVHISRLVR